MPTQIQTEVHIIVIIMTMMIDVMVAGESMFFTQNVANFIAPHLTSNPKKTASVSLMCVFPKVWQQAAQVFSLGSTTRCDQRVDCFVQFYQWIKNDKCFTFTNNTTGVGFLLHFGCFSRHDATPLARMFGANISYNLCMPGILETVRHMDKYDAPSLSYAIFFFPWWTTMKALASVLVDMHAYGAHVKFLETGGKSTPPTTCQRQKPSSFIMMSSSSSSKPASLFWQWPGMSFPRCVNRHD